jgi:DUF4097 and DUF4098 domain-containing protein YvlB
VHGGHGRHSDHEHGDRTRRTLRDAGADLEIRVPVGSRLEVESISAGVVVEGVEGALDVECISANVEIQGAMRRAEVATVSGGIDLTSEEPLERGSFESVSGNVRVRAPLSPSGRFSFETISGKIDLLLPSDTSAEFDIETFSGEIDNEFGPEAERDSDLIGSTSLEFATGGGGARVEIESFSGRISLRID